MSRYTKEQFDRLPKWAQTEIECLARAADDAKRQLVAVHSGTTDVWMHDGLDLIALPPRSHIRFKAGRRQFDVSLREGTLHINGGGTIYLEPRASNLVWIHGEDRP